MPLASSKGLSGSLTSTTNFLNHLKRVHKGSVDNYEREMKEYVKKRKMAQKNQPKCVTQPAINDVFPEDFRRTVSKTEKLVLDFIVEGMHPLSVVSADGFRALIRGLDPTAKTISRRTLTCRLKEHFTYSQSRISEMIREVTENLRRESFALACRRFKGSHTYDTIADMIMSIMKQSKIPIGKVVKAITDSGSNFLKAFREFSRDSLDEVTENDEEDGEGADIENCDFLNVTQLLDNEDNQSNAFLPPHHPCSSHMLNLICSADITHVNGPCIERTVFAKAQGIWNKISRSTQTAEKIKDICGASLVTPVCTRWNSFYDSLVCLLKYEDKLKTICLAANVTDFRASEVEFINQYIQCVKPIAQGVDRLQGENNTFYGELIPTLLTIEKHLIKQYTQKPSHCPNLPKLLLDSFRKRFASYLDYSCENEDAIIAAIAHPYFKSRWIPPEKVIQMKQLFKDTVLSEYQSSQMNKNNTQQPLATSSSVGTSDELGNSGKSKDDEFFKFEGFAIFDDEGDNIEERVRQECDSYMKSNEAEIDMLHSFPIIKSVFVKYNTPLPSSGPVERLFNYAKMILSPNRRRLSDENFEMLTLLRVNKV